MNKKCKAYKEYLWNLYLQQNKRCALSGVDINLSDPANSIVDTASIDRIDITKGYIRGNVQWIHKTVNRMKVDMSEDEFMKWINLIYHNKNITFSGNSTLTVSFPQFPPIFSQYPPVDRKSPYC